jgi:hypothetical protein
MIALGLLNEVRHRIVSRAFGISREHSNLMTLFVLGALVRALQRAAAAPGNQVRRVRSSRTAVGDTLIGAAAARETVNSIAGHPARDASFAAGLIAVAMTVHAFRPAIVRSLHAVRHSFRDLIAVAHRVRTVMRRWGISRLPEPQAQTLRPGPPAMAAPTEPPDATG